MWILKAELGVRLIYDYVENMQKLHSKQGVHLRHECVLYTRRYGKRLLKISVCLCKVTCLGDLHRGGTKTKAGHNMTGLDGPVVEISVMSVSENDLHTAAIMPTAVIAQRE